MWQTGCACLVTVRIAVAYERNQFATHLTAYKTSQTDYLNNVFSKNNYNADFVRRNSHSNNDSNSQTNSAPVTTASIPYIRGTSETTARILQPYLYSTFIQKFIVLQRGYHHARRLNKMNKIKSNDVKKKKISIKDKMDKKKIIIIKIINFTASIIMQY